ncbi:MAG: helix-turn-helix transcriptional regulator [Bacteroidales bacterium]|nr:helix-turn-helix transcriptional regulator [Bacteroidales bacterium]
MINPEINEEAVERFLKAFGDNVKRIRLEKNMTITALANKCNASAKKISRTEKGEYDFKISSMMIIANGLDVKLIDLLDFEEAEILKQNIWK